MNGILVVLCLTALFISMTVVAATKIKADTDVRVLYIDKTTGEFVSKPVEEPVPEELVEVPTTRIPFIDNWLIPRIEQGGVLSLVILSIGTLLGSTIFLPLSMDIAYPVLLRAGVTRLPIILAVGGGAMIGNYINYLVGMRGIKHVQRHVSAKHIDQAKHLITRWGAPGMLVALALPLPLPVADPITVIAGAVNMERMRFFAATFGGHALRSALVIGLIQIVGGSGLLPFTVIINL
jgi:membrane protein YqaA with SNARE-associated domain